MQSLFLLKRVQEELTTGELARVFLGPCRVFVCIKCNGHREADASNIAI